MRRAINLLAISAIALSASIAQVKAATIGTFDEPSLALPSESFYSPTTSTSFITGTATFNHTFTPFAEGCCWQDWSYSNTTNTTTPGPGNQYSAYAGSGVNGSANYGVAFLANPASPDGAAVMFATAGVVSGAYFTNTTYAALSMLNGDGFAKKFGGGSGNDPDFLELIITGKDVNGNVTGTKDFFLADYRFADNSKDYIAKPWTFVDLSSLGAVKQLTFGMVSSDNSNVGMNTPSYFAMDMTAAVPEPSSIVLLLSGLAVMIGIVRRRTVS